MAADAKGYYAALGLNPGTSSAEVRAAFRRLAKECHPDSSSCRDGGQRFRRISEAYEALSDADRKAQYDRGAGQSASEGATAKSTSRIEPVQCEVCGKITAQARRLVFWRVTSFIFVTRSTPVQKIFCQKCAANEQWKSTIWTSLLGWWGVPWGPVWSVGHGFSNALGGTREIAVDEALMWQNTLAFASRGNGLIAIGLGNMLRKSENAEIAQNSADVIRFFTGRGFDPATTLTDVWSRSMTRTAALFGAAFAVPAAAAAFLMLPASEYSQTTPAADYAANDPFEDLMLAESAEVSPVEVAADVAPPPLPTCDTPPVNNEILVDNRATTGSGHVLEIRNGTRGDAIVKLRDASAGGTVASFFAARGDTASLTNIPDGDYSVQYAIGEKLAEDCRTFIDDGTASASEFPGQHNMITSYENTYGGTRVITDVLTYTLHSVPGGNVRPTGMDLDDFNKS